MKTGRLLVLPLALLAAAGCRRDARPESPPSPPAPASSPAAPATEQTAPAATGFAPEQVFRRAFWRHPAPGDVILHAERHEPAGPGGVWRWALAVRPSPGLLAALRAPETFNLRPLPSHAATLPAFPAALPAWFPAPAPGDEVLATPGGYFIVLFRPSEGVLYARDHGSGLSAPAR
ncbi:MAG: hypothetical protein RLZZ50_758 [Verrucomicrobiota bacterium]